MTSRRVRAGWGTRSNVRGVWEEEVASMDRGKRSEGGERVVFVGGSVCLCDE